MHNLDSYFKEKYKQGVTGALPAWKQNSPTEVSDSRGREKFTEYQMFKSAPPGTSTVWPSTLIHTLWKLGLYTLSVLMVN